VKNLLVGLALCLLPLNGQAQDLQTPITVFAVAGSADIASTYYGIKHSAGWWHEGNPLVAPLERKYGPAKMLIAGAAMESGSVLVATRVLRNHRKFLSASLYVLAGVHGSLAVYNMRSPKHESKHWAVLYPVSF
jgi:hypothetical protein